MLVAKFCWNAERKDIVKYFLKKCVALFFVYMRMHIQQEFILHACLCAHLIITEITINYMQRVIFITAISYNVYAFLCFLGVSGMIWKGKSSTQDQFTLPSHCVSAVNTSQHCGDSNRYYY